MEVFRDEDERVDSRGTCNVASSSRTLAAVDINIVTPGTMVSGKLKEMIQFPAVPNAFVQKAKQLQRYVRENPTQSSAWWNLLHLYCKCKLESQQLLEICEKACSYVMEDKNDHGYIKLYLAQCKFLNQCHRTKEAVRLYKAMAVNGIGKDLHYFWIGYSVALVKDNKQAAAVKLLTNAIETMPTAADRQKIKIYLKDLETKDAHHVPETPKLQFGTPNHPQSESTPSNTNSLFDNHVTTPSYLAQGVRDTPPTPTSVPPKVGNSKVDTLREMLKALSPTDKLSKEISVPSDSPPIEIDLSHEDDPTEVIKDNEESESEKPESENNTENTVLVIDDDDNDEDEEDEDMGELPRAVYTKVNGKVYQKLRALGKGGSGCVYKVLGKIGSGDNKRIDVFALKQIKLNDIDAESEVLKNEVNYLLSLRGETTIVHLYDYELTESKLSLILELGEIDLRNALSGTKNHRLRINAIRVYWQQMLQAVGVIHEHRIVHSDLKPANFVICKGTLKLIDFGIAGVIQSNTTSFKRDSLVSTIIIE